MSEPAVVVPGALGALCLLVVCAVYWRQQSFRLDGALLAVGGLALLGLSYWQLTVRHRAAPDLARRLDAISDALPRLEAQVARLAEQQAELAAALTTIPAEPGAALPAEGAPANQPDSDAPGAPTFEIEVLGGVSDEEMAAGEAGRVIDHVFAALRQRVDIVSMVSEHVSGPRLRLGFSGA